MTTNTYIWINDWATDNNQLPESVEWTVVWIQKPVVDLVENVHQRFDNIGVSTKPNESIEKEKNLPIYIVYRNNDLFERQIPNIKAIFNTMGREVEIQSFPKGTPEEVINEWYRINIGNLSGKEIITDETAEVPYKMEKDVLATGAKYDQYGNGNLDRLLLKTTGKALFWDEYEDMFNEGKDKSEEKSKKILIDMIKKILSDPSKRPSEVIILSDFILDHSHSPEASDYSEQRSQNEWDPIVRYQKSAQPAKKVAEKIGEWFVEAGIDEKDVIVSDNLQHLALPKGARTWNELESRLNEGAAEFLENGDRPGNWIIVDRHSNLNGKIKFAKCLQLPESDFYQTAVKQDLLRCTDEEFNSALSKVLEGK